MITNSRQTWEIGHTVKVGFMSLKVLRKVPTPGDWAPDAYILQSTSGQHYEFVPHRGLTKLDACMV